jgi:DNA-binding NarL/FixJ family response regulator
VAVSSLKIGDQRSLDGLPATASYVVDSASIPGGAAEVVGQIVRSNPNAHILVLAESLAQQTVFPLLHLGVRGLITHDMIEAHLFRALEAVSTGGYWVPRTLLASFVESIVGHSRQVEGLKPPAARVSRREKDILDGLLHNLSNKEIAAQLNISERTVKFHVSNLLTKFSVRRRADLILLWYQHGNQPSEQDRIAPSAQRIQ